MADKTYIEAEKALDWYFQAREATLGIRAQSYEPSASLEWDDNRVWSLHAAHVDNWHHQEALRRQSAIEGRLRLLDRGNIVILQNAFTTRGWSPGLAAEFPIRFGRSLVGVAVLTTSARKLHEEYAWKSKVKPIALVGTDRVDESGERIYLADESEALKHAESILECFERIRREVAGERDARKGELRKQHKIFQPVREEARGLYDKAIDAYARTLAFSLPEAS